MVFSHDVPEVTFFQEPQLGKSQLSQALHPFVELTLSAASINVTSNCDLSWRPRPSAGQCHYRGLKKSASLATESGSFAAPVNNTTQEDVSPQMSALQLSEMQ